MEKAKTVPPHFIIELEGQRTKEVGMDEKPTWSPSGYEMENVSLSTRYCKVQMQ